MPVSQVTAEDLRRLARRLYDVDLGAVSGLYAEVVFKVRDLGIAFSDRRAVKGLKLLAASALLCSRVRALPSDLWVLRYVWDRAEQIGPLRLLINGILEQHVAEPGAHPLARRRARRWRGPGPPAGRVGERVPGATAQPLLAVARCASAWPPSPTGPPGSPTSPRETAAAAQRQPAQTPGVSQEGSNRHFSGPLPRAPAAAGFSLRRVGRRFGAGRRLKPAATGNHVFLPVKDR